MFVLSDKTMYQQAINWFLYLQNGHDKFVQNKWGGKLHTNHYRKHDFWTAIQYYASNLQRSWWKRNKTIFLKKKNLENEESSLLQMNTCTGTCILMFTILLYKIQ